MTAQEVSEIQHRSALTDTPGRTVAPGRRVSEPERRRRAGHRSLFTIPATDRPDAPPNSLNVLGPIGANFDDPETLQPIFEAQPPLTEPVVAPPAGPTAAYGEYLASYTCPLCHGADLDGNEAFRAPGLAGVGLTWTEEQFINFMRTGERPSGPPVDGELMPWEDLSELFEDDDELRAIFAYLGTLGG